MAAISFTEDDSEGFQFLTLNHVFQMFDHDWPSDSVLSMLHQFQLEASLTPNQIASVVEVLEEHNLLVD